MKLEKTKIFGKFVFYYLPDDKYVGQRIALEKYEPYETNLIQRQVKNGDVVVDVGANIGYYTVLLAQKVGKNGKVIAIEPDPINFEILQKNIKENKLKNVVAVQAAVGSENKKMILYKSKDNLGDHKLYETLRPAGTSLDRAAKKPEIFCRRLDDLLNELEYKKVDLIKIDTQGWEPEVIEGAKKTIEENKPIIFMEYSPASYRLAKLDGNKMMNFIQKIYKKIFWIDEWLYIYKVLDKTKIDQICSTNKTGYADLWMKKDINLKDYFGGFLNFKIKKWIKKRLFEI